MNFVATKSFVPTVTGDLSYSCHGGIPNEIVISLKIRDLYSERDLRCFFLLPNLGLFLQS